MPVTKRSHALRWARRLGCMLLAGTLLMPPMALARNGHRGGGYGGYPQVVPRVPHGHQSYSHHGDRYYRHGGVYYRPYGRGYRVVRPPYGMFIRALPLGFASLVIAGVTYYTFADIYYRATPGGYVVVAPPVGVVVTSPPPAPVEAPSEPQGTAVVTAPLLNVRSGPGMNYQIVLTVRRGSSLSIYGRSGGWLYVQTLDGQFGWVDHRFTVRQMPGASG